MEAIGSTFFLLLLFVGLILIVTKLRKVGLFFIGISIYFLYIAPNTAFKEYKKTTNGVYTKENRKEIIIENEKYEIRDSGKTISSGTVVYSNIDDYSFYLNPDGEYHSIGTDKIGSGEMINGEFRGDIYYKW